VVGKQEITKQSSLAGAAEIEGAKKPRPFPKSLRLVQKQEFLELFHR
jgi:hypothetical protein